MQLQDFIADCGIIEGTINLLQTYYKRRDENVVKNLISSMLWSLHVFTGGCSSPERNTNVRKRVSIINLYLNNKLIFYNFFYYVYQCYQNIFYHQRH